MDIILRNRRWGSMDKLLKLVRCQRVVLSLSCYLSYVCALQGVHRYVEHHVISSHVTATTKSEFLRSRKCSPNATRLIRQTLNYFYSRGQEIGLTGK